MACIEAPIEIVEIILSHLASDVPSLARCSVVDRAWLSLCRQWQFKDVDLTGYRMTSRHARFHKFMDLFERSVPTAPCTLNQYIQGLQIDPTFTPYHISCLNTIDLPNLRSIRIKTSPGTVPAYFLSAVSTTFSEKVHRLDVTSVTFPSQSALLEFLCAFPNLQELVFGENMYAKSTWHPPAASSQLSSNITSLKLSQRLVLMKEEMTAWIVGQIQRGTVQVKRYIIADTLVGGWSPTYPTHLLAAVANTVEELEVDLLFMTNSSFGFLASPNIRFPQLRTLRLNLTLRSVIRITPSLPLVDDWELEG